MTRFLSPLLLLTACAIDTAPVELEPVRWLQEAVTVCSAPRYEEATIAAAAAWTVGPELVYVGDCGDAQIAVLPTNSPGKRGILAQTVVIPWQKSRGLIYATVWVNEAPNHDLQAILTHELGHAIGLHDCDVAEATMFRFMEWHDLGPRDISEYDIEQVEKLYGR